MTRTLNETETRDLITAGKVGRLGCVVDGGPYVVPINYLFEDGAIYGHSLSGKKIRALRARPRACLQVDQVESDLRWRSAIAFGRFEEICFEREREQVLHKLLQSFPLLTPVESVISKDAASPEVIVFRIRVDRITGVAEE
jgi:nitroimidazol reductase NimA-like FMN-containing flavoprotein (pyridoxamine 5'-phosphate oxidase superfamily)